MFSKIMVPVDLAHADALQKALETAADLARHYDAPVCYVGVTSTAPGSVAHNPTEYAQKLDAFADAQGDAHGHRTDSKVVVSHDPATDLDDALLKTIGEVGADLVVMQSHMPNITDYVWPSNGGSIASHSKASVFLVR
ncbi:MAG: universal stress protein [Minwuia sp.]|uniref:universal stress protein n=1 Tax=Minwuia sp. TaxID=2493630 RepID=UPI003A89EC07